MDNFVFKDVHQVMKSLLIKSIAFSTLVLSSISNATSDLSMLESNNKHVHISAPKELEQQIPYNNFDYSKERVDYVVDQCIQNMKRDLSKSSSRCLKESEQIFFLVNDAHQLFMSDRPLDATIKYMRVLEQAAAHQKEKSICPYKVFNNCSIHHIYMSYYLLNQGLKKTTKKQNIASISPTDYERTFLAEEFIIIHNMLVKACNQNTCNDSVLDIIYLCKKLYDEITITPVDSHRIMHMIFAIRNSISIAHYSRQITSSVDAALFDTNKRMPKLFSIMIKHVTIGRMPLFDKYRLQFINLAMKETNISSRCVEPLYMYYSSLNSFISGNLKNDILTYLEADGTIFKALIDFLYHSRYSSSCTTPLNEIYYPPFVISDDIKQLIYSLKENTK